jgi:hypothetical protein
MLRKLFLQKKTLIVILVVTPLVVLGGIGSCLVSTIRFCDQTALPPEIPVYPNAVLVDQISKESVPAKYFLENSYFDAKNIYTTTSSLEDVFAFYNEIATCRRFGDGANCHGYISDYGRYFVYIESFKRDNPKSVNSYGVVIDWVGCSSRTIWKPFGD